MYFCRLKEFINDEEFSDITLQAEGKDIFCHKVILAQFPHFNQYFRSNKAVKVLKMKERYPVVKAMVEFIYTGKFGIHCHMSYAFKGVTSIEMELAEELYVISLVYELEDLVTFLRYLFYCGKF